jgi:hypothetical protein
MLLTAFALSIARPGGAADKRLEKTIVLSQVGDVLGATKTYVNRHAVKITVDGSSAYLIAVAPLWRVMLCNDANKKAVSMPFSEWMNHNMRLSYLGNGWDRYGLVITPSIGRQRLGRAVLDFKIAGKRKGNEVVPSQLILDADYCVLKAQAVADEACNITQKALSVPKTKGLPLELTKHGAAQKVEAFKAEVGGEEHLLSTKKIEEKMIAADFFAYPENYKLEKLEVTVVNDGKHLNHVERMVDDLFTVEK